MKLFDLHADTLYEIATKEKSMYNGDLHINLQKGLGYSPWMQCLAIWIPDDLRGKAATEFFDKTYEKLLAEMNLNPDRLILCKTPDDFKKAAKGGVCGGILTVEGGAALSGDINRLDTIYQKGVRMMTLTWNGSCEIGDGCLCENAKGLTYFGKEVIRKMQDLGMAIDVSHVSDKLFFDVIENTDGPIVASHSNSRRICVHKRNLLDEQFRLIKERSGIVGLNFGKTFLSDKKDANMYDIIRHADYFLSLGGRNTVALGSDFDGADMPQGITGVESIGKLYESFLAHGYNESVVEGIFWRNAFRFFERLLG